MVEKVVADGIDVLVPIVEALGAIIVAVGVLAAFGTYVLLELRIRMVAREDIRLRLGRFLALGLEFQLAADILATAVAPGFEEIGKLAAIAAIRTFLNYFLAKDIENAEAARGERALMAGEHGRGK